MWNVNDNKNNTAESDDKTSTATNHVVKSGWKNISSTLMLVVLAPVLAFFITSHIIQSYEVDGQSMYATLTNGDRVVVYKLGKTLSNIFDSTYMPKRGDIVIFDKPKSLKGEGIKHLIKRVVALPGERIVIKDGEVTVYNKDFEKGFSPDENQDYSENLSTTTGSVDITISEGEVFVLGDNRSNSADSRVFGAIDTKTIVGVAAVRFIPLNDMKKL